MLEIELRVEQRTQNFKTAARQVVLGKGAGAQLRVPLAWLEDAHLEIRHESGLLRVRTLSPVVRVLSGEEMIDGEWRVLPASCELRVLGSNGQVLELFLAAMSRSGMTVLAETPEVALLPMSSGAILVGVDGEVAAEPETLTVQALPPPRQMLAVEYFSSKRLIKWVVGGVVLLVVAALAFSEWRRSNIRDAVRRDGAQYQQLVDQCREQMLAAKYVEAKTSLDAAQGIARQRGWNDELEETRLLYNRPEIQYGANGYVLVGRKWVEQAVADAWRDARLKLDPRIDELIKTAQTQLKTNQYIDAQANCAQVLALIEQFPKVARPHPQEATAQMLGRQAKNEAIAGEMLAKGMVLYQEKWVTPDEKFALVQQAKGLVLYKGSWLGKEEAFATAQTDKGLVLYDDKWLTPDQKLIAQGYVQFEGKWVMAVERDNIQAQRAAEERVRQAEITRLAAARKEQEAARTEQERQIERRKQEAFDMSQVFIKKTLKHAESATFPDYTDGRVIVVYKDGWYLVRSPLKGENGAGSIVGRVYIVKLRPTTGAMWESDLADLLDE